MVEIDSIQPISWQKNSWHVLEMEADKKTVVRGLIESHHASSSGFDDFIPGKGRGPVFLLHGTPGCGKTRTAGTCFQLQMPSYTC